MSTLFLNYYSEHLSLLVRQAREAGATTQEILESTSRALAPVVAEEAAGGYASAEEGLHALLNAEGGTVPIADAAELYRPGAAITRQGLSAQIQKGSLIAVKSGQRGYALPVWQFARGGGLVEGLDKVLLELKKLPYYDAMLPFTFFLQRNPITHGLKPIDALRKGQLGDVLAAAASHGR